MARAFIHSGNRHLIEVCSAYFEVYGHTVVNSGPADVAIIDLDYGRPPAVEARIQVCISCRDRRRNELPAGALFRLKPVDLDFMMDCIMDMLEQPV